MLANLPPCWTAVGQRYALTLAAVVAMTIARSAQPATIWIEGEKTASARMSRHPWYDQVKRDRLSGGDLISNFNNDRAGEAQYDFTAPVAGPFDLWVRANPVQARLSYQLNGGEWTEIDLTSNQTGRANVAADAGIDLRFIAWIKVGPVTLRKGDNRIAFRMHSDKHNHGYLDCFVLASEPFQPQGILKPDELAAFARKAEAKNQGWFAFAPPADKFEKGSGFDLRWLNEKVAGEGGFIAAKGSAFVHSKTGTPIRFWGVNGPPEDLKSPEAIRANARLLAKYGVNLVRIHGGCYDQSGYLQPEKVQHKIDVVESMKLEGIYSHLSIYFPLWLRPKPDTPWLKGYDGKSHPFAALYFNEDFQQQYRKWWRAVLLTPSKRTGARLVDEPALAGVEIINEDSYFFWTFTSDNVPDPQLRLLEMQFADWLKREFGSLAAAQKRWRGVKTPRDAPDQGRIGFRPLWNIFNEKRQRDKDTVRFLLESQQAFYQETYDFLRGLGFKGLITCSNWTTASAEIFGPIEKHSYTVGDFVDRHGYFSCNHKGNNAAWSIRDGHAYSDRSALRFDAQVPGKPKQFLNPVMDPSYDGKPSMISETTFNRPNRYRLEAPLFYAAYGALQDSDAIVHFALDGANWSVKPRFFMQPWTLMAPTMMGQFPATALLYRQGLVEPGELLAEVTLGIDAMLDLKGTPLPQGAAFDELRLKDVPKGVSLQPGNVIDPLIHFAGRTNVRFAEQGTPAKLLSLEGLVDRQRQRVTSSTRQVGLDYAKGVLYVDAPAAQAVAGALSETGDVQLSNLAVSSPMELGAVIAVSLDSQPLARSTRILLQVMSEEKSNGFKTKPAGKSGRQIVSIGQDPWLVREIRGTVRFDRPDASG